MLKKITKTNECIGRKEGRNQIQCSNNFLICKCKILLENLSLAYQTGEYFFIPTYINLTSVQFSTGIKLNVSTLIDAKNVNSGGHKVIFFIDISFVIISLNCLPFN